MDMWPLLGQNLVEELSKLNVDIILNGHLHTVTTNITLRTKLNEGLPVLLGAASLCAMDARGKNGFSEIDIQIDESKNFISYSINRYCYRPELGQFEPISDDYLGFSVGLNK